MEIILNYILLILLINTVSSIYNDLSLIDKVDIKIFGSKITFIANTGNLHLLMRREICLEGMTNHPI